VTPPQVGGKRRGEEEEKKNGSFYFVDPTTFVWGDLSYDFVATVR